MNIVYLLLGGNLGDVRNNLDAALLQIKEQVGEIVNISKYYKTAAWGNTQQPDFINLAVEVRTPRSPAECLQVLLDIELSLGRQRIEKWGTRTIDIDILYYNDIIVHTQTLTIPHPEIQNRKFALVPLCDIAPFYIHPIFKVTNLALLEALNDSSEVSIL